VVVVASPSSSPSSSSPGALGLPFTKRQLNQGRRYLWQNTQRILITCMEVTRRQYNHTLGLAFTQTKCSSSPSLPPSPRPHTQNERPSTFRKEEPPCRGGNYDLLPSETVAGMPSELLLHICSLLDGASLLSVSLTCT
jgi:hypothetical protein